MLAYRVLFILFGLLASELLFAKERPGLILTQAGVEQIRAELGKVPLFDSSLAAVKAEIDAEIEAGIDTPVPVDYSGGYTHERHKRNFLVLWKAGLLYQILEEKRYAVFVRDMLFQYEAMYKDLPLHPKTRSYARGKLFWQCLNDANWLVYSSQAYDSIYDFLSSEQRSQLEDNLFRPFADHISVDSPQFFNRVHNHSTWGNAAVGLIGLVMGDEELIQRALYGIKDDGLALGVKDNDGGFIKVEGQQAGFLANLEQPFSPDGYYTEGPYYQRYAMQPFLIFAQGLHNLRPELKIFEHKDGVLLKAVDALLNLADANGEFFPLNDAQKGMSYNTGALVAAVNIAYQFGSQDPQLVSVSETQGRVQLDDAGFAIALASRDGHSEPFKKTSVNLRDGSGGDEGGVAVLRQSDEALTALFKYSAQGLSHGHYDKLSYSLYEEGQEVLQDYGMVRFVNIGQKGGGNYLKENSTWAKQTIAHNTVVQDEKSHFGGKYEVGSRHHSELNFFDSSNPQVQVVSARESNAYPGTTMNRTLALITDEAFEKPFLLDLFQVSSDRKHQYDLPFHYLGQMLETNVAYNKPRSLDALGKSNGYEHLYLEGKGSAPIGSTKFSWIANDGFYSLTSITQKQDEVLMARLGANDPDFNLRTDPTFVIRRKGQSDTVFASVVEAHGSYDPVTELAINASATIAALELVFESSEYLAVSIADVFGGQRLFLLATDDFGSATQHKLQIGESLFEWAGPYAYRAL